VVGSVFIFILFILPGYAHEVYYPICDAKHTYTRSYSKLPYWSCKLFNYALNDSGYLMFNSNLLLYHQGYHIKDVETGACRTHKRLRNARKILVRNSGGKLTLRIPSLRWVECTGYIVLVGRPERKRLL
jgi:hypothetical protein